MSELRRRLENGDKTLWPEGNISKNRLGWLQSPREMEREARDLERWAAGIDQDTVVLLGMGGSSLGPLVLSNLATALGGPSGRRLVVCDTTDPESVAAAPLEDAFVLVSSKSGTTLETNVLFAYARTRQKDPKRYAVITDPGSPLHREAEGLGVRRVFANRPDVGGRYSVLSYFGLVPAALIGYEVAELCGRALDADREAAIELGVAIGGAAKAGADKLTIVTDEPRRAVGLWLEQLVAESTGKDGRGCVPVPTSDPEGGEDRYVVHVEFGSAPEVAAVFYSFEIATAIIGHVLEIDPFDEPNVAESKANTTRVLANLPLPGLPASEPGAVVSFLEEHLEEGDYISIQAYLPYGHDDALEDCRKRLRDAHGGVATTAGYGPRFLHSTGQLHKGGPPSLVAIQVVAATPGQHVEIPGENYDFATLIAAQAIGDHESLIAHGRRVLRVAADDLGEIA